MSGFEVIAGGAGLLSLAIQLGDSAVKLKKLYHTAKNAPRIMSGMVFELETMRMALEQLEQHRIQDTQGDALLMRCIMACRQRTAEIKMLVDKIERHMTRGVWRGRVYTAFSERELKELLQDLERSKSLLHFAYTLYRTEEERLQRRQAFGMIQRGFQSQEIVQAATFSQLTCFLQPLIQHQQPLTNLSNVSAHQAQQPEPQDLVALENAQANDTPADTNHRNRPLTVRRGRRKHSQTRFRTSFTLPNWLCSRVWEIAMTTSQGRWGVYLQTYNLVPHDALVFKYCREGNLALLQKLIQDGEASLLDVAPRNKSLDGDSVTLIEVSFRYQDDATHLTDVARCREETTGCLSMAP